jgi:hypothetical protein
MSEHMVAPIAERASGSGRRRVGSLVAGSVVGVFAVVFLAAGGWALWEDRIDRDSSGFVPIGTTSLRTETYAIVGDLHGAGPSWLWESDVFGDTRVRATSDSQQPLFIGIARTDDLFHYLGGAGYATIDSFEVRADTTHSGGPPSGPPAREPIWAASTQGSGQQTLRWDSRAGDWSIVFMNADAGSGVALHGDAGGQFPMLPWVAVGLLVIGAASAFIGGWLLVRGINGRPRPTAPETDQSEPTATPVPVAATTGEEVKA